MGIRNILSPESEVIPLASVEVVEVSIGGTILTVTVEGGAVEISVDRGGLAVLPKATNRLLVQPMPHRPD